MWLSQALIAELFQITVPTVNEHLKGIYAEGKLKPEATIRKFRIVRTEGSRKVAREIEHYNLEAVLGVGFRVRSQRSVAFRQWATARLQEYLVKGFVMDDVRLKNPSGPGFTWIGRHRRDSDGYHGGGTGRHRCPAVDGYSGWL